jgi:hypothetical protein
MQGVAGSMDGRAAILQLLPFSLSETDRVSLLHGGYPEVLARPTCRRLWFSSYLQTYLERDVRAVTQVRDLATFRRFLALLASRHGQILNKTDLAAPLGVSVPNIGDWLHILEITGQVIRVPPYGSSEGAVPLSRSARAGSRFPVSGQPGSSVDGGVQSIQDRSAVDGRAFGLVAPIHGRSGDSPVERRPSNFNQGPVDSGAGAGD